MGTHGRAAAALLAASLLLGCGGTRSASDTTLFRFSIEGREYHILGSSAHDGEHVNLLVGSEGGRVAFRALDRGQDGVIDEVVSGEITLEEANRIYTEGIALSIREGRYRARQVPMVYELIDYNRVYVVRTYVEGVTVLRNTFTMYDRATGAEETFDDTGADGVLDAPEGDAEGWHHAQRLYARALAAGVRAGRIDHAEGQYRVR